MDGEKGKWTRLGNRRRVRTDHRKQSKCINVQHSPSSDLELEQDCSNEDRRYSVTKEPRSNMSLVPIESRVTKRCHRTPRSNVTRCFPATCTLNLCPACRSLECNLDRQGNQVTISYQNPCCCSASRRRKRSYSPDSPSTLHPISEYSKTSSRNCPKAVTYNDRTSPILTKRKDIKRSVNDYRPYCRPKHDKELGMSLDSLSIPLTPRGQYLHNQDFDKTHSSDFKNKIKSSDQYVGNLDTPTRQIADCQRRPDISTNTIRNDSEFRSKNSPPASRYKTYDDHRNGSKETYTYHSNVFPSSRNVQSYSPDKSITSGGKQIDKYNDVYRVSARISEANDVFPPSRPNKMHPDPVDKTYCPPRKVSQQYNSSKTSFSPRIRPQGVGSNPHPPISNMHQYDAGKTTQQPNQNIQNFDAFETNDFSTPKIKPFDAFNNIHSSRQNIEPFDAFKTTHPSNQNAQQYNSYNTRPSNQSIPPFNTGKSSASSNHPCMQSFNADDKSMSQSTVNKNTYTVSPTRSRRQSHIPPCRTAASPTRKIRPYNTNTHDTSASVDETSETSNAHFLKTCFTAKKVTDILSVNTGPNRRHRARDCHRGTLTPSHRNCVVTRICMPIQCMIRTVICLIASCFCPWDSVLFLPFSAISIFCVFSAITLAQSFVVYFQIVAILFMFSLMICLISKHPYI